MSFNFVAMVTNCSGLNKIVFPLWCNNLKVFCTVCGIQSYYFMANRWGEVEAVTDFIFLGSKITADSDCSHEIKRCLLLGRKAMKNLDSILKSRNTTLLTKVCIVKAMFFSISHVWM